MAQITIGTKLASYQVTGFLGKGGMGEVYAASDTRLGRNVAIKVLPDGFTHDPDRVSRFKREAKVLAALNHPNIATIHGLEETQDQQFLVMELVEGETLADKIARGALPVDDALRIALQLAEALEAAHEKLIVHRDLKPANVKVTPDGKVKVLDFGLAKAVEPAPANPALSNSPTLTGIATNAGIILGTAAYMSPEQAKGFAADPRSDVFSFGCVLYEMLTGRAAFDGDTVSEILAAVLKTEPDFTRLPTDLDLRLREVVQRTLAKNPKKRFQAIGDVRFEIERVLNGPGVVPVPADRVSRGPSFAWIGASAISIAVIAALAVPAFRHWRETPPLELRVEINTPATVSPIEFALSPDGRYVAFVASGDGPSRLWYRAFDKTDSQPLAGTEGANYPFWSPDSRSIGFTSGGRLRRVSIDGGPPQALANTSIPRSGAWNAEGTILFSAAFGPLSRVSASGGGAVNITSLDLPRHTSHRFPHFLPDGRHFLFFVSGLPEAAGLYLGSLDGRESRRLGPADSAGQYLHPGMVAFLRGTTLMAQHLDLERGVLVGDPVRIADSIGVSGIGFAGFSVSADGRIAYRGGGGSARELKWYDRKGTAKETVGESDPNTLLYPELSPDGGRVAVQRSLQSNTDVWFMDLIRGGMTRFTFDPAIDGAPLWSPDGKQIVFLSSRRGPYDLFIRPSVGSSAEELLLESPNNKYPQDWSKDGKFLIYSEADQKTGRDLWAVPISEKADVRKRMLIINTPSEELNGQFSPDGRWVAYETNESGRFEIVVQAFPVPSGKWQVSTGGGIQPRWRADGKELYFATPDGKLASVPVSASGSTFTAGPPVPVFSATLAPGAGANKQEYIVSGDNRFLINQPAKASIATPITLILNWKAEP